MVIKVIYVFLRDCSYLFKIIYFLAFFYFQEAAPAKLAKIHGDDLIENAVALNWIFLNFPWNLWIGNLFFNGEKLASTEDSKRRNHKISNHHNHNHLGFRMLILFLMMTISADHNHGHNQLHAIWLRKIEK